MRSTAMDLIRIKEKILPELPEVQTIVNNLHANILNKKIISIKVLDTKPLINTDSLNFINTIQNNYLSDIYREGKYLIFVFQEPQLLLIIHLRMTGRLLFFNNQQLPDSLKKHTRIIFNFPENEFLVYHDVRRFGTFALYAMKSENVVKETTFYNKVQYSKPCIPKPSGLALWDHNVSIKEKLKLGFDPLNDQLNVSSIAKIFQHKNIPIKNILLDQHIISGIGNIYACEALFLAAIDPQKKAVGLTETEIKLLLNKIKLVLKNALIAGGTTISDYRRADNTKGDYQHKLWVYGLAGELCKKCKKANIVRIKQSQRSTFYCPVCQK